jgi:kynurenine formamidase
MNAPSIASGQLSADLLFATLRSWRCIDLSVLLEAGIPRWPAHPHLVIDPTVTHAHDGYYCQSLSLAEHTGTHVDAPCHVHPDLMAHSIDRADPGSLIGRAVVADLAPLGLEAGQSASLQQVQAALASRKLVIGAGDILLIHFGWMRHWTTGPGWKYYATNQPGLAPEVADWILATGIKAVGTDTIAVGTPLAEGVAQPCACHEKVLRQGVPLVECLANLDKLRTPALFVAAALKIRGGSGSPIRALAYTET